MTTVAVLGTLDTKKEECFWLRQRLLDCGVDVMLIDAGVYSEFVGADVSVQQLAEAAGRELDALRRAHDRGDAVTAMGRGAAIVVAQLASEGRISGLLVAGGSGNASMCAAAMQALPIGFPKLLVSTIASGDVKPYVGETDATLMYSVVDIAGLNSVSSVVLDNAVAAIAGMAKAYDTRKLETRDKEHKPVVAVTMFGVTTPAADEARATLTERGYEVLVFHTTGVGGRAMEHLVRSGLVVGVCDLTTTELADEVAGGTLSAGPDRLEAAGQMGIPQVVSVGALDMANFGSLDSVPERFSKRNLLVHNPTVTLMRTTPAEMGEIGRRIASKLAAATGPTTVFLPLRGVSAVDVEGAKFRDAVADEQLFDNIRNGLRGSQVEVVERDQEINEPGFGRAMAERLDQMIVDSKEDRR